MKKFKKKDASLIAALLELSPAVAADALAARNTAKGALFLLSVGQLDEAGRRLSELASTWSAWGQAGNPESVAWCAWAQSVTA